ncbi:hypothetical protein DCAR_0100958 [Daucus carota subsp. sativus]|uniref:Uncharacterized protein n=1 Tax=Daucus carota subsp. sativus TaxID=79200 RepID=A0A166G1S6_DAUCS|nr:hypothetical protein DCAR_0100958 [Daucus carota subsp. sativus]
MADMEARRDRVKHNVACGFTKVLKKEEEERRAKAGSNNKHTSTGNGKFEGPDLKSFIQQFPVTAEGYLPTFSITNLLFAAEESGLTGWEGDILVAGVLEKARCTMGQFVG